LIEPVKDSGWLEGIEQLYIVPHGILHYLPFAALVQPGIEDPDFLIEDYIVGYLPSLALLNQSDVRRGFAGSLLSLAPERARLSHAKSEALGIAEVFAPNAQALLGPRATESTLKRIGNKYRILHIATHSYFNKINPLLSALQLEPDDLDDGLLALHEILEMRLNADLVTLSACDTALGGGYFTEIPLGDDFIGLTQAFLYAGSSSVLASLWKVDDRSTSQFMIDFYRQLRRTRKIEALALVQRSLVREGEDLAHPYYWAPFVLVGRN
jgi:CHAT domain-containing protein